VSHSVLASLAAAFESDDRPAAERDRLVRLMALFADLPRPPDVSDHFPRYAELQREFRDSFSSNDPEQIEERFLELYVHLHMHEAPYTPEERRRVDETGGYWSHAGGLSPILKAGDWLRPGSVSADLGAGNGLQGLLFQKLYPHRRTIQVEISGTMVEIGMRLQRWLDIPEDRVEWIVGDVMNASVAGIDFLYLYRPVRPDGPGRSFYERIATEFAASDRDVVIFSIADCLRDFLSPGFEVFYSDGHLTCFKKNPSPDS
jgi:hypothetical protein